MRKINLFFIILALLAGNSQPGYATITIGYSFERTDSASLEVVLSFTGNKEGRSFVNLPNEWAGQVNLYNAVSGLISLSVKTRITATAKPDQFLVSYQPGEKVTIKYFLKKDWTGPLKFPLYFHPVIEKDFFYFEGYSGLVYPVINDEEKIFLQLSFKGFEPGDFIGNSYFSGQPGGKFITNLRDLRNSIFCAGKYRHKEIMMNQSKVVIALTGDFVFDDTAVFNNLFVIIKAERKFWNDFNAPYFFATLLPMADQENSGGTAHYNSFGLFQSKNLSLERGLLYLISHEYFHNWIGQGLKMPAPEELYKWFQEGFTEYYSFKVLHATGLWSEVKYIEKLNQAIRDYYLSDYFATANEALIDNYWSNPALKKLSYQRGLILAFLIDNYLSKHTDLTLDDLMREIYNAAKPALLFSKDLFDGVLLKHAGQDLLAVIDRVNKGDNSLLADALKKNAGYRIEDSLMTKRFDLGFDLNASKQQKKIVKLVTGSNAELAGLKEGMEITGNFSIWNDNTEKPAKVQIIQEGQKKWIEFVPVAKIYLQVPQIVFVEK